MSLLKWIALEHNKKGVDLDAPETTMLHQEIIQQKRFLKEFYARVYEFFLGETPAVPGIQLEIGSGGGFIKQYLPNAITSDVIPLPGNDQTLSALEMPFSSGALSAIYLFDVLHHLPDLEKFFSESDRCLANGGRIIMLEPANTIWGKFVYQNFHHEPFEPSSQDWKLPSGGPMSMANGALPWIAFVRDRKRFESLYPSLKIKMIGYAYPLSYLLSGGVSMRQLLPGFTWPAIAFCEETLMAPFLKWTGMFMKIVIEKQDG